MTAIPNRPTRRRLLQAAAGAGLGVVASPFILRAAGAQSWAAGDPVQPRALRRGRRALMASCCGPGLRRALVAQSANAGRHAWRRCDRRLRDRRPIPLCATSCDVARRPPSRLSPIRCTLMCAGLQPGRPYWYRFASGDALSARRTSGDAAAAGCHARARALRLSLLRELRARLFLRLPPSGRRGAGPRAVSSATTSTNPSSPSGRRCAATATASKRPTLRDLSQPLCAISRSIPTCSALHAAAPCLVDLGRPRGARTTTPTTGRRAFDDPQAFLVRRAAAYQAFYEHMPLPADPRMPQRADHAHLRSLQVRRSRRAFGARRPAIPLARRPAHAAVQRRRPSGRATPAARNGRARPQHAGRAQEAWLLRPARAHPKATLEPDRAGRADGAVRTQPDDAIRRLDRGVGRLSRPTRSACSKRLAESTIANPVVFGGDIHSFWANDLQASISTIRRRRSWRPNSSAPRSRPYRRMIHRAGAATIRMCISSRAGGTVMSVSIRARAYAGADAVILRCAQLQGYFRH